MVYSADKKIIHKNANKRPTFVYMASSMREGVGLKIWQGILKKTREIDANLICYMGGELGADNRALIYKLINKDKIDGIISWAVSSSKKEASFYDKFKGFPFIALSIPVPGFPVVMVDSYQGMKEVVEHLIKEHSYTKIALVRGPEKHVYAAQRYNAYIDVVKENNIYDENLITAPLTWEPSSGVKGIRILLDERKLEPGKDIEAVVFVSDNHAIAVFDELTHRKIQIPEQLAITGYNATQEAFCTTSPITNVAMPFLDQGNIAVNLLIKLLNEEEIPMNTTLSAKLIVAQSCGCQSAVIINILVKSLPRLDIPGCYISLYENQADLKSIFDIPEDARLVLAYENGNRRELTAEGIIYPAKDLLPEGFLTDSKQKSTMVHPLNFNDIQLGFIIFEVGPEKGRIYFTLSKLLSSAIYGALLYQKSENINTLLQETLNNVKLKSEVVSERSNNISRNVNDISASMEEVAGNLKEMSKNITHVMKIVKDAVNIAKSANTEIIDLTNKSKKIGEITDIIIDITEQTKILALNASIEAARAGEKGKGFSVVAKEVRNLAKRTVLSTDEITSMIKTIQSQTNETADAITQVVNIIDKVSDLSFSITTFISEQATVTNEISDVIITAAGEIKETHQAISELVKLANADEDKT